MSGVNTPEAASGWDCHVHVFSAAQPTLPGHYLPQDHPLERIEKLAEAHGMGHVVLVQPSVYGSDNCLLLESLQASAGRHRGVVVVDQAQPWDVLLRWHALGVRGIRCNCVSPVGNRHIDWTVWAPLLRELGWHVQWYAHADQLGVIAQWQAQHGLTCVLDHVAGIHTRHVHSTQVWSDLQALADAGAWIKLSGWYRLGLEAPYDLQQLELGRICAMFQGRCVWGSDWPHTSHNASLAPKYDELLQPLHELLGHHAVDQLLNQARRLYV
jgi:predicted TIM-barrel fold metal-dependent hydrolase